MFSEGNPYRSSVETLIRFYIQKRKKITIFYPLKKNNQNTVREWKGGGGTGTRQGRIVSRIGEGWAAHIRLRNLSLVKSAEGGPVSPREFNLYLNMSNKDFSGSES